MTADTDVLVWRCDACGEPVESGAGYVFLQMAAIGYYRRRSELCNRLVRAPWHIRHRACDPGPRDGRCWFDVARAGTMADLEARKAALIGSAWFATTDWDGLVDRVLNDEHPQPK